MCARASVASVGSSGQRILCRYFVKSNNFGCYKESRYAMSTALSPLLATLADLLAQQAALAAPYDAQIRALEVARADATAALTFEIETLKALIRPLVLAEQQTVKVDGVTVSYCHKETWNDERLRAFAAEVPAVLQCLQDSSYVAFRYASAR